MTPSRPRVSRLRSIIAGAVAVSGLLVLLGQSIAIGAGQGELAAVRAATDKFHSIPAAEAAGYGPFYICTDDNGGAGAMGQHYVKGALVGDGAIDPLTPEALVYEPMPGGNLRLVGVEYVVFKADWDANHSSPPQLFGHTFFTIPAGNRYGLPDFYELHAWIWRPNPSGIFQNWNPKVSCRGNGDPA
jgi:hypothetical protein